MKRCVSTDGLYRGPGSKGGFTLVMQVCIFTYLHHLYILASLHNPDPGS